MPNGKIIKGIGGFYYVETADVIYECKARGVFRKKGITPLVGDDVSFSVNENAENTIDEILNRKNFLVRPPLANLDRLFIISSSVDPEINTFVIDRIITIAEFKDIEPIIVFTKTDLSDNYKKYENIYKKAGFNVICCNNINGEGSDMIKPLLKGKISAFTGNTGVGKSSLLNAIDETLTLSTGQTSKKLGRGRHTTRHCELFKSCGGYVADTPGFSSVDFEKGERILKDDLPYCFREFRPYLQDCMFMLSCSHTKDKGCAVISALERGDISISRHQSYVQFYNEVKDINKWELK